MKKFTFLLFLINAFLSEAQHYQFSQFYSAPLYLNPAFAGAGACGRATLNYRNQWSAVPGTFNSCQASYDRPLKDLNSGIGVSLFSDKAGLGNLTTTQLNLFYAYELKINRNLIARGGLSTGLTRRSINYSQLTFGDQIARSDQGATLDNTSNTSVTYVDIGTGYLLYSGNAWGGFSVNHLNRPNQSLNEQNSHLPIEWKFHGGYKFPLNGKARDMRDQEAITVAANYKKQSKFNQFDLGAYYTRGYFNVGLWYRGIPLYKPMQWYENNDALIVLIGFASEKFRIGYSFDYTLSDLSFNNTHGSHEISISYPFCNKKIKKRKYDLINCPVF